MIQFGRNSKIENKIADIKSPQEIKNMSIKELEELAVSAREFLINNISKTGGHLASNLGVVELTLGIHYVFDSPRDKIIWDVGHQAYIHKVITGRGKDFKSLRKTNGLSGFPKRNESEYDVYDTGHSSTSISAALGMATARDLSKDNYEVVAVIGDGSMTGGPSFEALNNIGYERSKLIIILNDNGMSISKNIGGIFEHLSKLRTSTGYRNAKEKLKESLDNVPLVGSGLKSVLANTKDHIKYMLLSGGVIFEELGMTYLGPLDGHNIEDVIEALENAKNVDGPVLVHFITQKGKGYKPAEKDPNGFHGIGPFNPETGLSLSPAKKTYSDVFGDAIYSVAKSNDKITAITAAMCDATGLSKMEERYPERVFDVGIAEAHGVIFAAGQALQGYHPYVAIYSSFLQRAYDEILMDICLQNLPVTLALDRSGIVGQDGETHHGIFDLSYLLPMPNMSILAPCDADQLSAMVKYVSTKNSPFAIRYPRGKADISGVKNSKFTGTNKRLMSGNDIDILAVGTMVKTAIKAKELLEKRGVSCGVIDIAVVKDGTKPNPTIEDYLVDKHLHIKKRMVTLEDNILAGGFGEFFSSLFAQGNGVYDILNLGWPNIFIEHGDNDDLYKKYELDGEGVAKRIMEHFYPYEAKTNNKKVTSEEEKYQQERRDLLSDIFSE